MSGRVWRKQYSSEPAKATRAGFRKFVLYSGALSHSGVFGWARERFELAAYLWARSLPGFRIGGFFFRKISHRAHQSQLQQTDPKDALRSKANTSEPMEGLSRFTGFGPLPTKTRGLSSSTRKVPNMLCKQRNEKLKIGAPLPLFLAKSDLIPHIVFSRVPV